MRYTILSGLTLSIAILSGCTHGGHQTTQQVEESDEAKIAKITADGKVTACKELLTDCQSKDPRDRSNSIEALSNVDPADAAQPVLKALSDSAPGVRYAAAVAAGHLRLKEAMTPLLAMADDKDLRVQAAVRFALHRLGDTRLSHDLEKLARTFNPPVQPGEDPEKVGEQIRSCAAQVLGMLGEPSAVGVLRPMLKDPSVNVRLSAAESLWRLGDQDGLTALVGFSLSRYSDEKVIAILAMGVPKDVIVAKNLEGFLTDDYVEVQLAAARSLGMLGRFDGWKTSLKYSREGDARQRGMAALALGAMGRPELGPPLAIMLKDKDTAVRISAATGLLELHD